MHQKEETFQVIIDIIKNLTCFKAFTITAEVLKIFMQQFWYTIKKVKTQNLMNSFWPTRSALSMLKSLERFWISFQELKVKNSLRLKFVRTRENYQKYRLPIPDMMETVGVSKDSEPEPAKEKTEQEAADIMQALKESKKTSRDNQVSKAQVKELVGYQGFSMSLQSSLLPHIKELGLENESEHSDDSQLNFDDKEKKDKDGDTDNKGDDLISDIQVTDDEDTETESDEDQIYKYKIHVRKDKDEEMLNAEVKDSRKVKSSKLEKDVFELKKRDHSAEALATLKSQVPTIHKIKREQAEKQKMPKYTIKSTDKAELKEYDQKSTLYQTMHENKSFNKNPANHALYHALMEALIEDENVMDTRVTDTVKNHKRQHDDDDDDDEDPSAGKNKGRKTKRQRTKESKSSKKPSTTKETPKGKAPSKGSKTGKSASTKELVEEPIAEVEIDYALYTAAEDVVHDANQPNDDCTQFKDKYLMQDWFKQPLRPPTRPAYNLLKGTCTSNIKLEYNFQECFNALIDKLDWNNLEGDRSPFDLSKPLALQGRLGHLTVAADHFFNYDLESMKTSDLEKTYTTLITKAKSAGYEIFRIEDMVKILGVKSVSVKKLHGYGHLEEVVVKRTDRQLYKFKEGNFMDLHLNDIEDMLLLAFQHKLFHLNDSDIVDFNMVFCIFTRTLIIKRRIEDLQLGVKSYQKKLNITAPQQTFPEIKFKEIYTLSYKPPWLIYKDLTKQKRVMHADKL
nr:hypothetical protein [Tanacetum cinerariifolium]